MQDGEWRGAEVPAHRFLPFERRLVLRLRGLQEVSQNQMTGKLKRNYGPEGLLFYNASLIWGVLGGLIGSIGVVLLLASGSPGGTLVTVGYFLLALCCVMEVVALVRIRQASIRGRRFREGRTFEKIGPLWQGGQPSQ